MRLAFTIIMTLFACLPAQAQDKWPQRPVSIVVPFGAGGSADLIARILSQHLQASYNVGFPVENRSGAGGSIGAGYVAKAAKDGYTLFLGTVSTQAINPHLYKTLPFDPVRDFQAVSLLVQLPNLLFVNPKISPKTVPELIAWLKANEGKISYGSSGYGTSGHLTSVMFQLASGTKMTHVPFRSMTDEMNSVAGGQIDLAIDSMTVAYPLAQSGLVRAVAVTTPKRSVAAPDLPTIGETLPGFAATGWQGLFAPAGTPRLIVDALSADVKRIFALPEVVESLKNLGGEPMTMSPDEFTAYVANEREKWGVVVKASGVKVE